MGSRVAVVACFLVVFVLAGCGEGSSSPTSLVRNYEKAIVSKDGDALCATFTPKLREVLGEQIANEQSAAGASGGPRYDCGAYYHLLIGYPHENVDRQFVLGKVIDVGAPSQVVRAGVTYMKVPAKLRIEFTFTGYSPHQGEKGAATVEDVVWLSKAKGAMWGVVKPSLGLVVASNPDVLFTAYRVAQVNAPPPDPDYTMNRAERTAYEASDYRASFRRKIGHTPLRCGGRSISVKDSLHDAVLRPIGATRLAPAPAANDIERVAVQVSHLRMCIAVTFREKPAGHFRIGFTPSSRRAFFGGYVIEIDPSLGARGGVLTGGYRYFRGGDQLNQSAVDEISLYGRTVAFAANPSVIHPVSRTLPADLTWSVSSSAPTGGDQLPNQAPGEWVVIRQSDGRVVKPAASR